MADERPKWLQKRIKGVLLDISGVLYNSGKDGGSLIEGSVQAVEKYAADGFYAQKQIYKILQFINIIFIFVIIYFSI